MDEFSLINRIKQMNYRQDSLIKGVGDDAAVFRTDSRDIVVAVDTFVEGIHFTEETLSPWQIGYRLLAVNLSDIAAMGAEPLFYLVSVVTPDRLQDKHLISIFDGMNFLAERYNIDLIGGDTVSGNELTLSVTVIGSVPKGKARYRTDAREGDVVFVTGTLGDARAGLQLLLEKRGINEDENVLTKLIQKHQQPEPRIHFAKQLQPLKRLALNDISDGLANELHEIAESSDVVIEIDDHAIPLSRGLQTFPKHEQDTYKYFGGEDFELVGTVCKNDFPFVKKVAEKLRVNITEIGSVSYNRERNGKVFVTKNGRVERLRKLGYVHRSKES